MRSAGIQYFNSTKLSTGTNAAKYVKKLNIRMDVWMHIVDIIVFVDQHNIRILLSIYKSILFR